MIVLAVLIALSGNVWGEEIAGIVVDEAGDPVPGATFSVVTMEPGTMWQFEIAARANTGDNGRFSLTIGDGKVKKPHAYSAFFSFYAAQHQDYGLGWTISLVLGRQGQDASDLRLVLPKRGSVRGKVTDSEGNPVEGAEVSTFITLPEGPADDDLRFLPPCEGLIKATTGADGAFVLDGLPADAGLMLRVKHPDFAVAVEGAPVHGRGMPMGTIPVGATDVAVKLEPGATIEGKIILEETGEPAGGVVVKAMAPHSNWTAMLIGLEETETNEKGRYVLRGLAAATYSIAVTHPDGAAAPTTVDVTVGAHMTNQDIVLAKGVLVSGKFVNAETGEPVCDAQVVAMPKGAMGLAGQTLVEVKPDGTFSFRHPPGEITLHAYTSSGGPAQLQLTLVEGEDQTDVTLELEPPLAFKGKVVGPDGKGLAGAQVRSKWGVPTAPTETAEDGTFELPLGNQRPGEWQWLALDATHPDLPGYRGMLAKPFQSESDAEGEIEMKRAGTIRGRVVKEDGSPIASAKVRTTINAENRGWPDGNVTTDESGRYDFSNALSGMEYNVTATADGYGQDSSERLALDEGESRELPDLVLIVADQVIEGTVVDEDGSPVAGATINCHSRATGSRQTTTDDKGRFRLENLVDENIRIWAFHFRPEGQMQGQARAMAGDTDVQIVIAEQARPVSTEERQGRVLAGKDAPELDVAEWINGEPITLASVRGKTVVLAFWDSADEACADLLPLLKDMPGKYPDIEIVSVHISGADSDALKKFISDNSVAYRVALDKPADKYKGATFETYLVKKPPAVFILDAEGKIRYQDIPLAAVEQALKTMLGEN